MATIQEPQGIPFFSVKTGETHYAKLEPTIAAYINSSDMGINASRGQDYGWRIGAEWVKKVKAFKRDATQMSILTAKNGGQKPTTTQILYYMYGEQLANFYEEQEENENPFEEQYQQDISGKGARADNPESNQALQDFRATEDGEDDMTDLIDEAIVEDEAPKLTEEQQKAADELAKMDAEKDSKKAKQSQK